MLLHFKISIFKDLKTIFNSFKVILKFLYYVCFLQKPKVNLFRKRNNHTQIDTKNKNSTVLSEVITLKKK